jgi:CrcB protein
MNAFLAIAAGGALGSIARHVLSSVVQSAAGGRFPWGILAVNLLGGFAMGLIVELSALRFTLSPDLRVFLTTGLLGGFTTFSAFSLDTALLIQRGEWSVAALYVIASVLLSVGALFAGLWLVRAAL